MKIIGISKNSHLQDSYPEDSHPKDSSPILHLALIERFVIMECEVVGMP